MKRIIIVPFGPDSMPESSVRAIALGAATASANASARLPPELAEGTFMLAAVALQGVQWAATYHTFC
jgi:hypothetical protein